MSKRTEKFLEGQPCRAEGNAAVFNALCGTKTVSTSGCSGAGGGGVYNFPAAVIHLPGPK